MPDPDPQLSAVSETKATSVQSLILGGLAGVLAPLSLDALQLSEFMKNMNSSDFKLPNFEWFLLHAGFLLLWGAIGAGVAYFLAEGVKRHIFFYGVGAPYIVLALISSQQANISQKNLQTTKTTLAATNTTLTTVEDEKKVLQHVAASLEDKLADSQGKIESTEAVRTSDIPAL